MCLLTRVPLPLTTEPMSSDQQGVPLRWLWKTISGDHGQTWLCLSCQDECTYCWLVLHWPQYAVTEEPSLGDDIVADT